MLATTISLIGATVIAAEETTAQPPALPTALLSIGYVEAKLPDFVETAGYEKRLADPTGFLAVSADFRGDGRPDQARILRNVGRGIAYVVVVSVREKIDTYVVKSMTLDEADNIGIQIASPRQADSKASGLTIFSLDGSGAETFDLIDDDFTQRAVP